MTEHKAIDPLLDETERAFEALKDGPIDRSGIASLSGLVERFRGDMLSHLDNEEPVFFPLLTKFMPDDQSERLAAELAKKAPRKGLSWLMGGVRYGMTEAESTEFLADLPEADPVDAPPHAAQVRQGLQCPRCRSRHSVAALEPATRTAIESPPQSGSGRPVS